MQIKEAAMYLPQIDFSLFCEKWFHEFFYRTVALASSFVFFGWMHQRATLVENGNFKYLHSIVFVHQTKQKNPFQKLCHLFVLNVLKIWSDTQKVIFFRNKCWDLGRLF